MKKLHKLNLVIISKERANEANEKEIIRKAIIGNYYLKFYSACMSATIEGCNYGILNYFVHIQALKNKFN